MIESAVPPKFPIPWGNSAGGSYIRAIPTASQIGVEAGAASLTDGFPPVTFEAEGSGGTPPWGQDFNGILKQITQWLQWAQAGGPVKYDSAFQTAIGGYPKNATVFSATTANKIWLCLVDNNGTNPDTGGAGWEDVSPDRAAGGSLTGNYPNPGIVQGAGLYTGQFFFMSQPIAPAGSLFCGGQAVSRAGPNAALFAYAAPSGTPLTPYGPGNGTTTFNVPNGEGLFLRGYDPSGTVDPGHAFGTKQGFAVQSHQHNNGVPYTTGSTVPEVYGTTTADIGGAAHQTVHTDNNSPEIQALTSFTGSAETRPVNLNGYLCVKL